MPMFFSHNMWDCALISRGSKTTWTRNLWVQMRKWLWFLSFFLFLLFLITLTNNLSLLWSYFRGYAALGLGCGRIVETKKLLQQLLTCSTLFLSIGYSYVSVSGSQCIFFLAKATNRYRLFPLGALAAIIVFVRPPPAESKAGSLFLGEIFVFLSMSISRPPIVSQISFYQIRIGK